MSKPAKARELNRRWRVPPPQTVRSYPDVRRVLFPTGKHA